MAILRASSSNFVSLYSGNSISYSPRASSSCYQLVFTWTTARPVWISEFQVLGSICHSFGNADVLLRFVLTRFDDYINQFTPVVETTIDTSGANASSAHIGEGGGLWRIILDTIRYASTTWKLVISPSPNSMYVLFFECQVIEFKCFDHFLLGYNGKLR